MLSWHLLSINHGLPVVPVHIPPGPSLGPLLQPAWDHISTWGVQLHNPTAYK
jgi:hypothetical protein